MQTVSIESFVHKLVSASNIMAFGYALVLRVYTKAKTPFILPWNENR